MTVGMDDGFSTDPVFPPLLNGIRVKGHPRPFDLARRNAAAGKAQAGDFYWGPSKRNLECALVLEPETHTIQSLQMLPTAMVAFGDSFGALAPPEIGVFYRWPQSFVLNDAIIGLAQVALPAGVGDDDIPDWLVVGIQIALRGNPNDMNPGENLDQTNLFEEGVGDLSPKRLLESVSRHLLVWIHTWNDEGFRPVHENWVGRAEGRGEEISVQHDGHTYQGTFLNLDDDGNLLLKTSAGKTISLRVRDFAVAGGE